jgi:hypothetical protein
LGCQTQSEDAKLVKIASFLTKNHSIPPFRPPPTKLNPEQKYQLINYAKNTFRTILCRKSICDDIHEINCSTLR